MAQLCSVRALNAHTRAREQVHLRGTPRARRNPLERGVSPRVRRNPLEGVLGPSSEAEPARVGAWALERGGTRSRGRLVGPLWRAVGATVAWAASCVRAGFPRFFRGPSGLSPTVAPEHLRACQPGSRRC
jgi:hypothetical protein